MNPQEAKLPRRETRGKRMSKLLDDETEADEQFWNQDAFKEAENDQEYEEEAEIEDEFDSDFNDEESEGEEDDADGADEKRTRRKARFLPGNKSMASKKAQARDREIRTKGISIIEDAAAASAAVDYKDISSDEGPKKKKKAIEVLEDQGDRRKSSRTAVIVKAIERETIKASQQPRVVKRKKNQGEERKWTQEEMLLEAAQTEILNRQSLEMMLAREEEVKRKAIIQKEIFAGPKVRLFSKDGKNIVEFTQVSSFPPPLGIKAPHYAEKTVCAVTGLPAKWVTTSKFI